jgi:hypothetical protein
MIIFCHHLLLSFYSISFVIFIIFNSSTVFFIFSPNVTHSTELARILTTTFVASVDDYWLPVVQHPAGSVHRARAAARLNRRHDAKAGRENRN